MFTLFKDIGLEEKGAGELMWAESEDLRMRNEGPVVKAQKIWQ